ncbi:MAG TPA: hypothetical protein VJK52_01475 [Candidatus Nanoarchaeia archaeon]|nr:hypothetical protein [Candidatus Nanoarchaeia archaeon]
MRKRLLLDERIEKLSLVRTHWQQYEIPVSDRIALAGIAVAGSLGYYTALHALIGYFG